ncbi:unnamed protein product [Kluyveromyces dobzhanskii CBS 2104]|uniref:WGS project CCBQ000000000 data, contig 00006 n=1 Tax=Kluyveromyces dobzhanskii CBS 2104 TaxID=1427455 RepID=A0A0A8L824_9SACH|nr:unnamed protein product [Kluyveromyces dobzhanskii CBS 2104]
MMSELSSEFSSLAVASIKANSVIVNDKTINLKDEHADSHANERRSQALQRPVTIDGNTGEVLVRKTTGKTRIRRGQSTEEYQEQLEQYFLQQKGPTRTEENALQKKEFDQLIADESFDYSLKQIRQKMVSYAQLYYYERDYSNCLKVSELLLQKFEPINKKNKLLKELDELKHMIEKSKARCT